MLTRFDEWTCHQTVETFAYPATSDRAWTEKLWMNLHDPDGQFALALGLGVYPNRNVMDGFACLRMGHDSDGRGQTSAVRQSEPAAQTPGGLGTP